MVEGRGEAVRDMDVGGVLRGRGKEFLPRGFDQDVASREAQYSRAPPSPFSPPHPCCSNDLQTAAWHGFRILYTPPPLRPNSTLGLGGGGGCSMLADSCRSPIAVSARARTVGQQRDNNNNKETPHINTEPSFFWWPRALKQEGNHLLGLFFLL